MIPWTSRLARGATALFVLSLTAVAHDDDPKMLDRRDPHHGPGFRAAPFAGVAPGATAPPVAMEAVSGFPASGVTLLGWLPLNNFLNSPSTGNDCWGYTSGSGREYALFGHRNGTAVIEISNPGNPQIIADFSGPSSLWRDVKVYGDYAYAVSEAGDGIQVFELTDVDSGVVVNHGSVLTGGPTGTHNVVINEETGHLFRTGGGSDYGLRVYDLNVDPINPPFLGSWLDRYVHDAQVVVWDTGPFAGKELAFCCSGFGNGSGQTGFDVVEITVNGGVATFNNFERFFYPNAAYSHQGWMSPDEQTFYLGDEWDEGNLGFQTTWHVLDISDPANISWVRTVSNGSDAITHNLYTHGDLIYAANYTSGLRVLDASGDQTNPVEVAYYDTWPSNDQKSYNGLWSCYPYFPSGVVIGSDIDAGFFTWWVGAPLVTLSYPSGIPDLISPPGQSVVVQIDELNVGDLDAGTPTMWLDSGSGFQAVPLVSLGGNQWRADFGQQTCGDTMTFYFSAESTNGITWNEPAGGAAEPYVRSVAAAEIVTVDDAFEAASGWTAGLPGDTATTGQWERVDPDGTSAQPEDDHTVLGTDCWVTGQTPPSGGLGDNDVDNGVTTLVSPVYDLTSTVDPTLSYWRWFSNDAGVNPNEDILEVEITDDGSNWFTVEVVGPTGPDVSGGWILHSFLVSDFVSLSSTVQVRFRVGDLINGSIVEAAIDDLSISDFECEIGTPFCFGTGCPCANDSGSTGCLHSGGVGATLSGTGSTSVSADDASLTINGAPPFNNGIVFMGSAIVPPFVPSSADGLACTGGGFRFPGILGDGSGMLTQSNLVGTAGAGLVTISSGETWHFQGWFRDNSVGPCGGVSNLSHGVSITFTP